MASGAQHFKEAERLLEADPQCSCLRSDCEHEASMLNRAQVHATLALAAATADPFAEDSDWIEAFR